MASKSAREFTLDLKKFGKFSVKKATVLFRKVALDLDSRIVLATPVDTGLARGGWLPTVNTPSGEENTDSFDLTGVSTVGKVVAVVASAKLGDVIWLSNSVPYINDLEKGTSRQAPVGMVDVNLSAIITFYGGNVSL